MNRNWKQLGLALLVLLPLGGSGCGGGGGGGGEDGGGGDTPTYKISGKVTGETLADVTGVQVDLTGAQTASTTTASGGDYSFEGLGNGSYSVTPSKAGCALTPAAKQVTIRGADEMAVDFVQTPTDNMMGQAFLYVPNAVFIQGPPPSPSGATASLGLSTATRSSNLSMDSSIVWTVTWPLTNAAVDSVDLYIPDIGGYFEYPVGPADASDGQVQIEMYESSTRPSESLLGCVGSGSQHSWWCYATAPSGTTDNTAISLIGADGDVGQPLGGIGITWGSDSVCGNGACESGETSLTCPTDCLPVCGDNVCEGGETSSNCPTDCLPVCGDSVCEGGETSLSCPSDCVAVCGNGVCESGETSLNCPSDCNPVCGNVVCESGETSSNCPGDCLPVCGNSVCESGETSLSCPSDCVPAPVCGNGTCESGETSLSCPSDCGTPSSTCGGSGTTYCSEQAGGCGVSVSACANTGAAWYVVNGSSTYCCASQSNCIGAATTVANIIAAACAQ